MSQETRPALFLHPFQNVRVQPNGDSRRSFVLVSKAIGVLLGPADRAYFGILVPSPSLVVLGAHAPRRNWLIAAIYRTSFAHLRIVIAPKKNVKKMAATYCVHEFSLLRFWQTQTVQGGSHEL